MADLLASEVVINETWTEGNTNGRKYSYRQCNVDWSGQGATGADIPAAAFQLATVVGCSNNMGIDTPPGIMSLAEPSVDQTSLTLYDPIDGLPVALSAEGVITVWGTTV